MHPMLFACSTSSVKIKITVALGHLSLLGTIVSYAQCDLFVTESNQSMNNKYLRCLTSRLIEEKQAAKGPQLYRGD